MYVYKHTHVYALVVHCQSSLVVEPFSLIIGMQRKTFHMQSRSNYVSSFQTYLEMVLNKLAYVLVCTLNNNKFAIVHQIQ